MVSRYQINNIKIYKYIMPLITSNMYLLIIGKQALVIDPHENHETEELLNSHGIMEVVILLTHEHFDHISGVNFFRERWNCKVYGSRKCKEMVTDPAKNLSAFYMAMFITKSKEEREMAQELFVETYSCKVDVGFEGTMEIEFDSLPIKMIQTPGHSPGSICIIIDQKYIFTGDSLVGGNLVITRLPGGSRKEYNQITRPFLEGLPENMIVFPGHGEEGEQRDFKIG